MWIKRIQITNWRAYQHAVFEIPRGKPNANIVIIGAENGKGKTSLLEAVTCCLFGKDGFSNLGRADKKTYAEFITSAFCKFPDKSPSKASVQLVFDVDGTHEISVERIWHFKPDRKYDSDELFIKKDGQDLRVPAIIDHEPDHRETYLKGYIAEKFMPAGLLPFFLFDGVRVQQLAQRGMTEQVESGIQGILGVDVLKDLIKDLHKYASNRLHKGKQGRAKDEVFEKLEQDLTVAASKLELLIGKLKKHEEDLVNVRAQVNALLKQYSDMGGDDVAKLGELREQEGKLRQEGSQLIDKLSVTLFGDFAMSLAGADMLTNTAERLRAEKARADWEHDKIIGKEKYEKFITNLKHLGTFTLPLSEEDIAKLRDNLKKAWNEVWYPMPGSCAKQILNPGLSHEERNAAEMRLWKLAGASLAEMKDLRDKIIRNEQGIANISRRINVGSEGQSKRAQELLEKIQNTNNELQSLVKIKAADERDKDAVDNELARLRQEMGRELGARKGNDPMLRQSAEAEKAVSMIEEIISVAYPSHVKDIANAMTSSYLAMAHKKIVSKIEINENCDVHLLSKNGDNLRELDPSHGESEIFSLALIAAIARVSKNQFPFIIDTPLANLDEAHRRDFLRHFSSDIDNQILFLSTNEEIREEQILIHQHRIAQTFLVEQEFHNGHGMNVVYPGKYFWEIP